MAIVIARLASSLVRWGNLMPKYYFNLKGNGDLIESDRPIQFPCLATAKADALVIVRGMLADLRGDWQCGTIGFAFEICDEAGEVLDIVRFEDAVLLH
jgi:hypothetical protein